MEQPVDQELVELFDFPEPDFQIHSENQPWLTYIAEDPYCQMKPPPVPPLTRSKKMADQPKQGKTNIILKRIGCIISMLRRNNIESEGVLINIEIF